MTTYRLQRNLMNDSAFCHLQQARYSLNVNSTAGSRSWKRGIVAVIPHAAQFRHIQKTLAVQFQVWNIVHEDRCNGGAVAAAAPGKTRASLIHEQPPAFVCRWKSCTDESTCAIHSRANTSLRCKCETLRKICFRQRQQVVCLNHIRKAQPWTFITKQK